MVFALALVHAVVWYPAEILDAAAGFVYGFGLGAAADHGLLDRQRAASPTRSAPRRAPPYLQARGAASASSGPRARSHEGGVTLLLAMRLIPIVPFSLFSIAAGAARVPIWRFTWTTAVGYLPITAIFVYLGSQLEELSPTDPILIVSAVVLVAMLLGVRYLRPRFGDG